ncbi:MAG: hypothetical protein ACRD3A_01965 [Terriglobales bacterium]
MKIFDRIVAILIMLLGSIHSAFSPVFHGHYDEAGMWFLSGGLMMIFIGLMNLVRTASAGAAARRAALAANVLGLAFVGSLVPLFPPRQNPQVVVFIGLVAAATILTLTRRDTNTA